MSRPEFLLLRHSADKNPVICRTCPAGNIEKERIRSTGKKLTWCVSSHNEQTVEMRCLPQKKKAFCPYIIHTNFKTVF